jgi:23S rRNA pseudouridine1911/1915/1917 synthase
MRLDVALIKRHPELSRRKAREVIEKGQVTLGGNLAADPGLEVAEDADLLWNPNRPARRRARSSLPLLYENARFLIADKPAGLLTVPSAPGETGEDTAVGRIREYARHLRPRDPYVGLVHRIDRDTSGAVAFALDREARQALIGLFARHDIERQYLALVRGEPRTDRGRIDVATKETYREGKRQLAREGEEGRPAITHFEVRERLGPAALLALRLETGRQHQIRLHLAHLGHPVLGDRTYAPEGDGRVGVRVPRLLLHAEHLGFRDPFTAEEVRARSPLPADFEAVLGALRRRRG